MPTPRKGYKILTIQVAATLVQEMEALAREMGRSVTAEAIHAFHRHLRQPPQVAASPLEPAYLPGRKRGRPPLPPLTP